MWKKSLAFLYTNNNKAENQTKASISFTIPTEKKYLVIHLTKQVKDLYKGNYKTMMKKLIDDRNKNTPHVHGSELIPLKWPMTTD